MPCILPKASLMPAAIVIVLPALLIAAPQRGLRKAFHCVEGVQPGGIAAAERHFLRGEHRQGGRGSMSSCGSLRPEQNARSKPDYGNKDSYYIDTMDHKSDKIDKESSLPPLLAQCLGAAPVEIVGRVVRVEIDDEGIAVVAVVELACAEVAAVVEQRALQPQ